MDWHQLGRDYLTELVQYLIPIIMGGVFHLILQGARYIQSRVSTSEWERVQKVAAVLVGAANQTVDKEDRGMALKAVTMEHLQAAFPRVPTKLLDAAIEDAVGRSKSLVGSLTTPPDKQGSPPVA